ncbi:MAG: thioredoxin domain-containing protein [Blastocatellia bacterium]|nr:thioredoxin domain-containing protein [Blastocatellia bacterium]
MSEPKHTNRLIHETSPYLRQHAHNPVDWFPWGEEALSLAKALDKPILLSIGYSACHWCHVMEHESFENEGIASLMNRYFVNIKVDREERPDLDAIYMNAVQMLTGRGGWPMTVFLTPDQVPFFGGTYFPPQDRYGMPGFPKILLGVADAYETRREEVLQSAREILDELQAIDTTRPAEEPLTDAVFAKAYRVFSSRFDWNHGGFAPAPKFPNSMSHSFLLRYWYKIKEERAKEMVELTLLKMSQGGMYDQLGGGFHRYSTDARWLVPHFEKMLYDNALLVRLLLEAYQITGEAYYRQTVEETLDYVLREMTSPAGGFYSTQDADSEGVEGKFFIWSKAEVEQLLGTEDADLFCRFYDVTEEGNFEETHRSILNIREPLSVVANLKNVTEGRLTEALNRGRRILFEAREQRIKPGLDDKQLTAWNGLMLASLARAGAVLGEPRYVAAAVKNAEFILANLYRDGRLLRTHKDGESKLNGYLEDYSFLIDGLVSLYETTFETRWLEKAQELADVMLERFSDTENGGLYFTSNDHETLISRTKDFFDNATPSGNSVAVDVLLRLGVLTGVDRYRTKAEEILLLLNENMEKMPSGFAHLLCALDFYLSAPKEIAVVGDPQDPATLELLAEINRTYLPNRVLVCKHPADTEAEKRIPLLRDRTLLNGQPAVYVCENFTCQQPVTTVEELRKMLKN